MGSQTSQRSSRGSAARSVWDQWFWLITAAALFLFAFNLNELPLQMSYEGRLARAAEQLWLNSDSQGAAFPLMELAIAALYQIFGQIQPWLTRFPGAFMAALSVSLLYSIGREIFPRPQQAVASSLVYLTLLPVLCYGRLANGDGAVLFFWLGLIWCVLRSRRNLGYCLGIGFGISLLTLLKGWPGLLWGLVPLIFLILNTPRLFTSLYFWSGLGLGIVPALFWYASQIANSSNTLVYFQPNPTSEWLWLELWRYGLPWLLFFPNALAWAWQHRHWSWGGLILTSCLAGLACALIAPMTTWLWLPLAPMFALAVGIYLEETMYCPQNYPGFWSWGLGVLTLAGLGLSWYLLTSGWGGPLLLATVLAAAITALTSAVLATRRNWQFLVVLIWGSYVSLVLLLATPLWGLDPRTDIEPKFLDTRVLSPQIVVDL